jgi:hypothetical protein
MIGINYRRSSSVQALVVLALSCLVLVAFVPTGPTAITFTVLNPQPEIDTYKVYASPDLATPLTN